MNKIIADEEDINDENFQNPSFLAKDLIRSKQFKIEQLVNNINDELINLRNIMIRKEIPENENPNKIIDIVEKIHDFQRQPKGKVIKISTTKQIRQRISIALAEVKAGNTSEKLLNEVRQTIFSLHREEQVTKKVYNNIMNSIKLENRMDTILMNSGNIKTSEPNRLLLNLLDEINLWRRDKYVALSNWTFTKHGYMHKKSYKKNKFNLPIPIWNETFELPDWSYSVSDIQDSFEIS